MRLAIAALFLTTTAAFAAPSPLPLDVAYARRELWRAVPPALSPDGRFVAYEINTPAVRTSNGDGEREERYLPNGMPGLFAGLNLWVADVATGESMAICRTGPCWRGSWSPSSRQLAYYSGEEGGPALWLYDVASRTSRRVGKVVVRARLAFDQAAWSADGKTLYVLLPGAVEKAAAPASKPPVTVLRTRGKSPSVDPADVNVFSRKEAASIAAVDVATGASRVLVPFDDGAPFVFRLSPDGKWLSYLSVFRVKSEEEQDYFRDLVILPASGGRPLVTFRDLKEPEDENLFGMYQWTPGSQHVLFSRGGDLWLASLASNVEPRRLGEKLGTISASSILLTGDGRTAIVTVDGKLAAVPLDGSEPRKLDVAAQPIAADARTVWQQAPGSFVAIRTATGSVEREVLEVDLATGKTTRLWSGAGRFTTVGASGGQLVSRFESPTTAPDLFLFDRRLAIVRRLSHAEPRLEGLATGPVESFETVIGGPDGKFVTMQSRVLLPPGAKRGDALPTVVYVYAGNSFAGYAHDYAGGAPSSIPIQIFTSRGYAVLLSDVPLGPEGKPGNPVQEMTDAILAQVQHSATLGYTDIKRVALLGQSYGGYSAAAIITRTNLFRASIALDGVYDLPGAYGEGSLGGFSWAERGQGRMGTHPWANLERYIANSPYYQADKIHTPLLLIHGEKDGACPVLEAKKMYNALKRLDRDAELAIYAGEGHVPGRWALPNAIDMTQRMLDFLDQHLREP